MSIRRPASEWARPVPEFVQVQIHALMNVLDNSWRVRPTLMHPERSGTYAESPVPVFSETAAYFISVPSHDSAGRITRLMPSSMRSKLETSRSSCLRPAAVTL